MKNKIFINFLLILYNIIPKLLYNQGYLVLKIARGFYVGKSIDILVQEKSHGLK